MRLEAEARMGKFAGNAQKVQKTESAYHLACLMALGVVSPASPTEYRISHLGKSFVREARSRDHDSDVLRAEDLSNKRLLPPRFLRL